MNDVPVIIEGDETSRLDPTLADGGLPPMPGVENRCVFRATRSRPDLADQLGYTYHHHVDAAIWSDRLYVAWNSCERDEDVWPSRELLSTSLDGRTWTPPVELFPQGVSTALRMYFYLAPNQRMLVIAGLRTDTSDVEEDRKHGVVVREIDASHRLGDVFTLRGSSDSLPDYRAARDRGLIEACDALLADRIYLEQQDHGVLLGDRRMPWHDPRAWPGGVVPGDDAKWTCGKAWSFLQRPDGVWLGTCKMGYSTLSRDGVNWSMPVIPPSLVVGKAKTFAHRAPNGQCLLAYNPSRRQRFPLAVVHGTDGQKFGGMRIVHGQLPIQRYEGRHRSIGPQYVRGVSRWSDDGSRSDAAVWLVYSVNKEDIWISRLPLPLGDPDDASVDDRFDSSDASRWHCYVPKWADIGIESGELVLRSRDPFDDAVATRTFQPAQQCRIDLDLSFDAISRHASISLISRLGGSVPLEMVADPAGEVTANGLSIGRVPLGASTIASIWVDSAAQNIRIALHGLPEVELPAEVACEDVQRLCIRTGLPRNIGGLKPVADGSDQPCAESVIRVRHVRITRA